MKIKLITTLILILSIPSIANELTWKQFIQESLKDDSFKASIYQFRNENSYVQFKDAVNNQKKYKKEEMKALYESHDAFAAYLMFEYFYRKGQTKKTIAALQKLYIHADASQKRALIMNIILYLVDNPDDVRQVAYYEYFIKNYGEDSLGDFFLGHYKANKEGLKKEKVEQALVKIESKFNELRENIEPFGFYFDVKPLAEQRGDYQNIEVKIHTDGNN